MVRCFASGPVSLFVPKHSVAGLSGLLPTKAAGQVGPGRLTVTASFPVFRVPLQRQLGKNPCRAPTRP